MAKSRWPPLRAVVAAALVVLGLAVVFTALLLRDGRPATAQQAAEAYVEAYNSRDAEALEELLLHPAEVKCAVPHAEW